jgi:hypothetical protein
VGDVGWVSWPHGPPPPPPRADAAPRPAQLTGLAPDSFDVVSVDGSPCGAKTFVLWNPPPLPERRRARPGYDGPPARAAPEHALACEDPQAMRAVDAVRRPSLPRSEGAGAKMMLMMLMMLMWIWILGLSTQTAPICIG